MNFSNAEELIFYDQQVQKVLPAHMFSIFEQWRLAQRMSFLKQLGRQAILDFLNGVTDDDLAILEEYFGEKIIVEKLNYRIVTHIAVPLDSDVCQVLCDIEGFNYFSTWRDENNLYMTLWR